MIDQLRTALRYTLLEISRNRLAAGLLIIFVPLWYYLLGALIGDASVAFKYGLSNRFLQVDGHNLTLITTGLNTVALIMAFLFFASTRGSAAFDQRLVRSGFRQATLMLAKAGALIVASAVIASYSLGVLMVAWRPRGLILIWVSFFLAGLIYGALGLLLGALLRNELAGFFIIIMVSLFDTLLQNPLDNPVANQNTLKALPSYGPTQVGVAGGFTALFPGRELLISLAWFGVLVALGLAIFWLRTRSWNASVRGAMARVAPTA